MDELPDGAAKVQISSFEAAEAEPKLEQLPGKR